MAELAVIESGGGEWSVDIPRRYISQVKAKLEDGTYPTEDVRCFCGADFNDVVITNYDRFQIPHRVVMCRECCLMRATPRMTQAAYDDFYNIEYRKIYDGWQFGAYGESDDFRFMRQMEMGFSFKQFIDYFNLKPKVVVDLGCNMGGMLLPFQDDGAKVYGAEICSKSITYGRNHGIPIFRGGIEEIAALGIKADLVVMQDVAEHLLNLDDLEKVSQILTENGVLYIGTPGLFQCKNLNLVFQNAHTHQFIAETLNYVMGCLGFDELYLDENIDSLWVYHEASKAPRDKKPTEWGKYIFEHLEGKEKRALPPLRCFVKFTVEERWQNVERNLAHQFPDFSEIKDSYAGDAIVVGGGPSVDTELPKIKELVAAGHKLVVIERMYPWCKTVGLTPDFVVSLDGSEGVDAGFTAIQDGTIHLLGSTTHSAVGDLLVGHKTYIFNTYNPHMKVQNLWAKYGYTRTGIVNTGGSVTIASMSLSLLLGFKNLHIFGFDCMVPKEKDRDYASGIAGESVERKYFEVEIEGEMYWTCSSFLSFAQQFFQNMELARQFGLVDSINVYGDSLVNVMFSRKSGQKWDLTQEIKQ